MIRSMMVPAVLSLALAACGGSGDDENTETRPAQERARGEGVATALYAFNCGTIGVSDLDVFAMDGSYAGETDTFTDTCFVIRHPEGDLLWDLGVPATFAGKEPQTDGIFTVSLEKTLVEQMAEADMTPGDIDIVAISHSHFDHVGQPEAAGDARGLVHQAEYDYMFSDEPPGDFSAFEKFEPEKFTGDHDVFGDGAIRIMEMPGHTPGHTVLLVNMAEAGAVLLAGDMYHRKESREGVRVPSFNTDTDATKSSIERFEAIAEASKALVIIQHQPDDIAKLPKAPEALK